MQPAAIPLATMPLDRVPVVALDLETTGLKVTQDRVVQIGAIGSEDELARFSVLVNPGIPIPALSTRIHGITDEMVADAPTLPTVLPRLRAHIGGSLIVGYNIGFDLAILEAESARHGIEWSWRGAICLRQLASRVLGHETAMMLSDLESLAAHFDVSVSDRHTALGDAAIAMGVFRQMLPLLAARSIITVGDAWREMAALDEMRRATVAAGWIDVASAHTVSPSQALAQATLARIDPYPYQHRIRDLMLADPVILPADAPTGMAATRMQENPCDCIFVGDDAGSIQGIVSERDIVTQVSQPVDDAIRVRERPVASIMSSPVITVGADDFMHVALGRMSRHDIRHLGVTDSKGHLCGWVSSRELVRQRVTSALVIGDMLAGATDTDEMATGLRMVPALAASLQAEAVPGEDIAAVISGEYRTALATAARLAEARMQADGQGDPPAEYTILMLGSAARGESMLAADQDHAIIFDPPDGADEAACQDWFMTLGGHIADRLDAAGIPYCKGGVMSREAAWCRSLADWRRMIGRWVRRGNPQDLLSVDIFFDFAAVYGSARLAAGLQAAMSGRATRRGDFLKLLARNVGGHAGGRGFFGGLRTEAGRFNMKANIMLPLVETLRVLAISRGIEARSSADRAAALAARDDMPPEVGHIGEDVAMAIRLVLRQQIADRAAGLPPTTKIDLATLSPNETRVLKSISSRVTRLDTLLADTLFDG